PAKSSSLSAFPSSRKYQLFYKTDSINSYN
ncbi:hypothetical protein KGM_212681B, partial [Danaus plexippus plexippus]